jgi:hypothetical protein
MFTQLNRVLAFFIISLILFVAQGCKPSDNTNPLSADQQHEQSPNAAVRLSGNYTCVRLQLDNGYTEGRGQLKGVGYLVAVRAKGDSVQLALTGDGTAGAFNGLDLGTYAVDAKSTGGSAPTYFTIKKNILTDYNAVTVVDRNVSGKQITYSFPISLFQFLPGTAKAGQFTPVKASDIFTATQKVVGIFTLERTITIAD